MAGDRTLTTPDFIEDPDFIPPDDEQGGRSGTNGNDGPNMMPRLRRGIPVDPAVSRIPDPISGLQGEDDTTGLTVARQPNFIDRMGQSMDRNLRQLPEAVLRSVTGKSTPSDNAMGDAISDNLVGSPSDSAVKRLSKSATILPRMAVDTVRGAFTDPASTAGDVASGLIIGEAAGGGNGGSNGGGRGRGSSPVPKVEAEAGASSNGDIRSSPGGSGTRVAVPSGTGDGPLSGVAGLLKKGGAGNSILKFVAGHRGSMLMDAAGKLLGVDKEPVAAAEAPLPHASAGKGVFGTNVDQWGKTVDAAPTIKEGAPFPRRPSWQSQPNVDVSQGGHSVNATVQDQASTAGQPGSADRVATEVQMSPAPQKLVRRTGLNPDPTAVKRSTAIPSPDYDPNIGVGPKQKDIGAAARAEQPPMPRGNKRVRVRTDRENSMQQFWNQARQEAGGDKVEGSPNGQGKVAHTGVGDISPASTDQISARANELYQQHVASKLKKVPSSGVGSVGDINPHPRQYYPENPESVPDSMVDAALKLKKKDRIGGPQGTGEVEGTARTGTGPGAMLRMGSELGADMGPGPSTGPGKKLFHGTRSSNIQKILDEGLKGYQGVEEERPYLTEHEDAAQWWSKGPYYEGKEPHGPGSVIEYEVPKSSIPQRKTEVISEDVTGKGYKRHQGEFGGVTSSKPISSKLIKKVYDTDTREVQYESDKDSSTDRAKRKR